jgi:hypothetical protein
MSTPPNGMQFSRRPGDTCCICGNPGLFFMAMAGYHNFEDGGFYCVDCLKLAVKLLEEKLNEA